MPSPEPPVPTILDRFALLAAVTTAVLSFTPVADMEGSVFIIGACLFWAAFVLVRAWQDRDVFRRWGFRADNLLRASVMPAVVFALGAAGLAAYAWHEDRLRFPPHQLLLFLVYPVWGFFQQMLMLGIFTQALEEVDALRRRPALLVLIVALVFGLIHAQNLKLVVATFVLELLIVPLYLRHRNLWPLGVLHGWLGGLFYLWVLNRDLWVERFG
jgi:hypothetical protein